MVPRLSRRANVDHEAPSRLDEAPGLQLAVAYDRNVFYVFISLTYEYARKVGVSAGLRRTQFRRDKTDPPERVFGR